MLNYSLSHLADDAHNIVLIHGLFGDKDNLNNLKRALQPLYNVVSVDLPDHGLSPRTVNWEFATAVDWLAETLSKLHFFPCTLVGHSLGGKVAMAFALTFPDKTQSVIAADIAPTRYTPRHGNVFKALNAVDVDAATERKDAANVLNDILVEPGTAQFLLKSFKRIDDKWQWLFNLPGLQRDYPTLSDWPYTTERYEGPVDFIKGERSDYINPNNTQNVAVHFPNASYKMIGGTGHWLHAEKPDLFNRMVLRILNKNLP